MTTIKLQRIHNSLLATIPRWFCHKLGLVKGDVLEVQFDGDSIRLRPIQPHQIGPRAVSLGLDGPEVRAEERGE